MGGCLHDYGVELFRNKHGAVFVAYQRNETLWRKQDPGLSPKIGTNPIPAVYKVGAAFCDPADLPGANWSRADWQAKGRLIAEGRRDKGNATLGIEEVLVYGGIDRYVCETKVLRKALLKALIAPAHQHGVDLDKISKQWGCRPYSGHHCQFHHWYSFFLWQLKRDELDPSIEY
jgi:hypothetical protein